MAVPASYHIYQTPVHAVGKNVIAGGVILDRVITDEGYRYDFFNKSHKVTESGTAWMYELPPENAEPAHIVLDACVSELQPDPNDPTKRILYSHMILDLDSGEPYNINTMISNIGNHIDSLDPVTYYNRSANQIIQGIDSGDRILFAVLYNMYYYRFEQSDEGGYVESFWPYLSFTRMDATRMWYSALAYSVEHGNRQYKPGSSEYITDWPGYTPGYADYHPYYFMSHPGLVFECFRECPEEDYTIRSLNGFDNHGEYHVNASRLASILTGNHWGLQIFADGASPSYEHIANILEQQSLINNFSNLQCPYGRIGWPLFEYEAQLNVYSSDRTLISLECQNNTTWMDPNTGTEYPTNILYDNEPIDTPLNYPIFVAIAGHVNRRW